MQTKPVLTVEELDPIMAACRDQARALGLIVTIAIVDDGGYPLRLERMDGAGPTTTEAAIEKARTAALIRAPTVALARRLPGELELLRLTNLFPMQGGQPLMVDGVCVGGLGISGAKPTQDDEVAVAGCAILGG